MGTRLAIDWAIPVNTPWKRKLIGVSSQDNNYCYTDHGLLAFRPQNLGCMLATVKLVGEYKCTLA
jgi:hypothetical protein